MPLLSGCWLFFVRCFLVCFVVALLLAQELDAIERIRLRSCGFLDFHIWLDIRGVCNIVRFVLATIRRQKSTLCMWTVERRSSSWLVRYDIFRSQLVLSGFLFCIVSLGFTDFFVSNAWVSVSRFRINFIISCFSLYLFLFLPMWQRLRSPAHNTCTRNKFKSIFFVHVCVCWTVGASFSYKMQ